MVTLTIIRMMMIANVLMAITIVTALSADTNGTCILADFKIWESPVAVTMRHAI